MEKEIPRNVADLPSLSAEEIKEITDTVFIKPEIQKTDIMFIFGSSQGDWQKVAQLFLQNLADKILICGLTGNHQEITGEPLSHMIKRELIKRGVPEHFILLQDRSTNTLEDVRYGKELLEKHNIYPASILFVSKSHHSGRAVRTLKKFFPATKIYAFTYDAIYNNTAVSRDNWWNVTEAKSRVYGEHLRIKRYSERGDIV